MNADSVVLILFIAISLLVATMMLLVRDVVLRRRAVGDRLGDLDRTTTIGRLPLESELGPPRGITGKIDHWFGQLPAETGWELAPEAAFLAAVAGGVLLGGVVLLWSDHLLGGVAGMVIGMLLVIGLFAYVRNRQRRAMHEQLPDVMELLARAVRAGESLDQAIELVGRTVAPPLGTEFRRCAGHLGMGLSMDSAMRALMRRAPLAEVRILAATLIVQRHAGGNLPATLERLVGVVRDRLSYQRQFRAATAAGRFSVTVIALFIPMVAAYLCFQETDYIRRFLASARGQVLLIVGASLYIIGLVWIFRLLRSNY